MEEKWIENVILPLDILKWIMDDSFAFFFWIFGLLKLNVNMNFCIPNVFLFTDGDLELLGGWQRKRRETEGQNDKLRLTRKFWFDYPKSITWSLIS